MDAAATPRRRRSSKEVRETILALARELFDAHGYEATTTIQIAKAAGVSERLIFSNFGTKAELFNAAVITPFASVITSYVKASARDTRNSSMEERIDYFVRGLYDLAREHRTALLTALQASSANGPSPHENVLDFLARSFQGTLLELSPDEEFREDYDDEASLAAFVGMVFGVALLDPLIFPVGYRRPSRRRLIEEMRKTTLVGVARDPDSIGRKPRRRSETLSERPKVAYKVLTAQQMEEFARDGSFAGAPVDLADGYVHLSCHEQLTETVDKHFAGQQGLYVAAIDLDALGPALKWELSRGGALFPHLYAPLAFAAVIASGPLERDGAGAVKPPVRVGE